MVGQTPGQATGSALAMDVIRQVQQATGQGPGTNMRGDVTDPIVAATRESTTRLEGAIRSIQITPGPAVGGTAEPTPPRTR